MFLIISWVLSGAVLGSVGVAWIASVFAGDGPRGDINIGTVFFWLFVTTALGAAGGGILGRMAGRKFADDPQRLSQLAVAPLIAAAILVGYAALKP